MRRRACVSKATHSAHEPYCAFWQLRVPTIHGSGARLPMSPRPKKNGVPHCAAWSRWCAHRLPQRPERRQLHPRPSQARQKLAHPGSPARNHRPPLPRLPGSRLRPQALRCSRQRRPPGRLRLVSLRRLECREALRLRNRQRPPRRQMHPLHLSIKRQGLRQRGLCRRPSADTTGSGSL